MAPTREQWKEWTSAINEILTRNRQYIDLGTIGRLQQANDDPLWGLIQTSSMRSMSYMSRSDYTKLLKILNAYLKSERLSHRLDIDKIKIQYLKEIDSKFKENPKVIWRKKDLEIILKAVVDTARSTLTSTTYYIPCHLPPDKDIKSFNIGEIEFLHIDLFLDKTSKAVNEFKTQHDNKISDLLVGDFLEVFNNYAWVAKIKVDNCDVDMGYKIAEECAANTVAFISIFYDDEIVNMIHKGEFEYSKTAKFCIDSSAKCAIKVQRKFKAGKESSSSWLGYLLSDKCKYPMECFEIIIRQKLCADHISNSSQAFLNSLAWYYDAINDKNRSAATIKFATCLESLIPIQKSKKQSTSHICQKCGNEVQHLATDGVRKNFITWVTFLFEGKNEENHESISSTADIFYDARSSLVHGNSKRSNRGKFTQYGLWEIGRRLTQSCLPGYLLWMRKEGFEQGFTDDQVEKFIQEHLTLPLSKE